jgi:intraflagellar transport protein 46
VGEVDAFIKMPRPDGQPETLGLNILDEPALNQSDKAKIHLMMLNTMKQYRGGKYNKVHAIKSADKNPKQILAWINSVNDIHKNKQPPSVSYSNRMPDVDSLMQVWPPEVEDVLSEIKLPSEDLDVSLEEYCKMACNLIDIPVYDANPTKNLIESLHVMFTLYSGFKENPHFQPKHDNESFVDK